MQGQETILRFYDKIEAYKTDNRSTAMHILIIFDSFFGNTEKIARIIGESLSSEHSVVVTRIEDAKTADVKTTDLLVIGSPTRAFRPSPKIAGFIRSLTPELLKGKTCAVYDTRIALEDIHSWFLGFMVKFFGYAAEAMEKTLVKKGAAREIPCGWFYVADSEGPLKDGETERAVKWIQSIVK